MQESKQSRETITGGTAANLPQAKECRSHRCHSLDFVLAGFQPPPHHHHPAVAMMMMMMKLFLRIIAAAAAGGVALLGCHSSGVVAVLGLGLLFPAIIVQAYPYGAGGCAAGRESVNRMHFDADSVSGGTLAEKGVTVTVNGMDLVDPQAEPPFPTFPIGQDLSLSVTANEAPMRGILVRAEALDGSDAAADSLLLDSSSSSSLQLLQPSSVCAALDIPISGVTHTSNVDKTIAEGISFRLDRANAAVLLDVTVVFVNNDTLSDYAYTGFTLAFGEEDGASAPTTAPTNTTTAAPAVMVDSATTPTAVPAMTPVVVQAPSSPVAEASLTSGGAASSSVSMMMIHAVTMMVWMMAGASSMFGEK